MNELEKQARKDREQPTSREEKLENKLEAAQDTFAKIEGVVEGHRTSENLRRGVAKRESFSGSRRILELKGSSEVKSPTCKSGKEK